MTHPFTSTTKHPRPPNEFEREVITAYRAGMAYKAIVQDFAINSHQFYNILHRHRVPLRRKYGFVNRGISVCTHLTESDLQKLKLYARSIGATMAEAVRHALRLAGAI